MEVPTIPPMSPAEFETAMKKGMLVLDPRSAEAIAGSFIPGSLTIPLEMVPAFAGHLIPYDKEIGLITGSYEEVDKAVRYLIRIGYESSHRVPGAGAACLAGERSPIRPHPFGPCQ